MKREFHVRFCESLGETLGYSTKTPLIGQEFPLKASALEPTDKKNRVVIIHDV